MVLKLVCIPAFNEEKSISAIIGKAKDHADQIVVCDDGSTDETSKIATLGGAKVLRHKKNLGKGAAMKTLFEYAKKTKADVIVMIDGDGQFNADEIPKLVEPIQHGYDVVIGNRFGGKSDMPQYRAFGNKILDRITHMASDLPFSDTQSGFRAYSGNAVKTIDIQSTGFGTDAEILVDAVNKGLKITEIPVSVLYKTGSRTSTKNPLSHTSEVILSLIELISIKRPLSYLGVPGMVLLVMGVVFSVIVVITFNETRYFSIPFTLLAIGSLAIGLMLLLMSVVLFSIKNLVKRK